MEAETFLLMDSGESMDLTAQQRDKLLAAKLIYPCDDHNEPDAPVQGTIYHLAMKDNNEFYSWDEIDAALEGAHLHAGERQPSVEKDGIWLCNYCGREVIFESR